MELLYPFIKGFLFSLSLCLDLGMVNVAIMKTGVERGFKPSFMIGFGSCFGDMTYLILALLGITIIFQIEMVKWMLWIVGTLVLLYLTYKMIRETWNPKLLTSSQIEVVQRSPWKDFLFGIGVALSSPTVIVWFAAVAGPMVSDIMTTEHLSLFLFVTGFFAAGIVWSIFIAAISSQTGKLLGTAFVRYMSLISACLFLYFAVKVFLNGLDTILR